MVLVTIGVLVGLSPMPHRWFSPADHRVIVEHLSEVCVLLSLMGVGLALDRPLQLRNWHSWKAWSASWRLLGIAMPPSPCAGSNPSTNTTRACTR